MNNTVFLEWLRQNRACDLGCEWIALSGLDARTAWQTCERPDWLLWCAVRCGAPLNACYDAAHAVLGMDPPNGYAFGRMHQIEVKWETHKDLDRIGVDLVVIMSLWRRRDGYNPKRLVRGIREKLQKYWYKFLEEHE